MKNNEERIKELRKEREDLIKERVEVLTTTMKVHLPNRMIKTFQAKVECIDRNLVRVSNELYEIDPEEKERVDNNKKVEEQKDAEEN